MERRIGRWRALYGPSRDVIFRREHPPGPGWAGSLKPLIQGDEGFLAFRVTGGGEGFLETIEGISIAQEVGDSFGVAGEPLQGFFERRVLHAFEAHLPGYH